MPVINSYDDHNEDILEAIWRWVQFMYPPFYPTCTHSQKLQMSLLYVNAWELSQAYIQML